MTTQTMPPPRTLPGDLHAAISGDLLAYMGRRRISQQQLADAVGVNQGTISRWLNKSMSVAELDRVLAALGLAGRLSLVDAETGQVTHPYPRRFLAISGVKSPHKSRSVTQSPLMNSITSSD